MSEFVRPRAVAIPVPKWLYELARTHGAGMWTVTDLPGSLSAGIGQIDGENVVYGITVWEGIIANNSVPPCPPCKHCGRNSYDEVEDKCEG